MVTTVVLSLILLPISCMVFDEISDEVRDLFAWWKARQL